MKKKLVILFSCFIFIMSGCNEKIEVKNYDFPLDKKDIDESLLEIGLQWNCIEEKELGEGNKTYFAENEEGKYCINFSSTEIDEMKAMNIILFDDKNNIINELTKSIKLEEQIKVLKLASQTYGADFNYDKLYEKAIDFLEETDGDGQVHYYDFFDGTYIKLTFSCNKKEKIYNITNISLLNKAAFESNNKSMAIYEERTIIQRGIPYKAEISIEGIGKLQEKEYISRINGKLELIETMDYDDIKDIENIYITGDITSDSRGDYKKAILVNEEGKTEVLLKKSGLTKDDLSKDRIHYFYFNSNNKLPIINYSVI